MARSAATTRHLVRDMGACLNFLGGAAGDRVTFADPGAGSKLDLTSALTFSLWCKLKSYGPSSAGRFITKVSGTPLYAFHTLSGGQLQLSLSGTGYTSTAGVLRLGDWHHVAVTWDKDAGSNEIKFYVDGAAAGTASRNTVIGTDNGSLHIGNNQVPDRKVDGKLDGVSIYSRALAASEIDQLAHNASPDAFSGLVLWCKFDEGSGTSATDSSASPLSAGTITGASYSTDVFIVPRSAATGRTAV